MITNPQSCFGRIKNVPSYPSISTQNHYKKNGHQSKEKMRNDFKMDNFVQEEEEYEYPNVRLESLTRKDPKRIRM
jgi:hypothetical protein